MWLIIALRMSSSKIMSRNFEFLFHFILPSVDFDLVLVFDFWFMLHRIQTYEETFKLQQGVSIKKRFISQSVGQRVGLIEALKKWKRRTVNWSLFRRKDDIFMGMANQLVWSTADSSCLLVWSTADSICLFS